MNRACEMSAQLQMISELAFCPENGAEIAASLSRWDQQRLDEFFKLLREHHMVLRVLKPLETAAADARLHLLEDALGKVITAEHERIRVALQCLNGIVNELESAGCPVVLFKTLDHWPDFGSDLDLCTIGDERYILQLLSDKFRARKRVRSAGDHLAHKWSFELRGDPTEVEIHINRLGHAGEHVGLATRFITRRRRMQVNGYAIPVPAPEERVIAATLQRMYRHLYFRVCDIVNLSTLMQSDELCYEDLRSVAEECGIWPGVAAFLKIVSGYVRPYVGSMLALPVELEWAAGNISSEKFFIRGKFFRLSFVPYGAWLFLRQFAHTLRNRDFTATARLSMLPPLASVGSVAYVVTGNSGRIW